jgi:uncharacterized repeat protein (TIGR03843 family)
MEDPDGAARRRRLRDAPLEVLGRFADASNATLLVRLLDRDPRPVAELAAALGHQPAVDDLPAADLAVYKPRRGEAPLWDFPAGSLHRREVAADAVSRAAGWGLVPATVLRDDGPYGPGSLQRFVPHDPAQHYFWLLEHGDDEVLEQLVAMVLFDLVVDNADRKGGHVLLEATGDEGPPPARRIRVVDHGVCFHVERKLRTVAWDLEGSPIPAAEREALRRLADALDGELAEELASLLDAAEVEALRRRVAAVLDLEVLPGPTGPRPYPWPLL